MVMSITSVSIVRVVIMFHAYCAPILIFYHVYVSDFIQFLEMSSPSFTVETEKGTSHASGSLAHMRHFGYIHKGARASWRRNPRLCIKTSSSREIRHCFPRYQSVRVLRAMWILSFFKAPSGELR